MSRSMRTAEGFTLHMQWIEQFVREAEQALEQADVKTTAQTVLFYAGMHVDDWLLAPEEIVKEALKLVPTAFHRLLQLSLRAVIEDGACSLSDGERAYIHTYAGLYISRVQEQAGQLAARWLH
jgi:hypothetical protein